MDSNTIIDLGKPLSDILAMIGFPPEPTALLERVEGRREDPDIAGLVAVVQDQWRALKAAETVVDELFTHLATQTIAETLAREDEEEEEATSSGTDTALTPDDSTVADLVERMKPRLDDPGIKELVLALELQSLSLRRANEKLAKLAR